MIRTRPASRADAARLSEFGAATFRASFEAENAAEDMARYVAKSFTPERQAAEIDDPAGTVLLAEHRDASGGVELVGYAHLVSG